MSPPTVEALLRILPRETATGSVEEAVRTAAVPTAAPEQPSRASSARPDALQTMAYLNHLRKTAAGDEERQSLTRQFCNKVRGVQRRNRQPEAGAA